MVGYDREIVHMLCVRYGTNLTRRGFIVTVTGTKSRNKFLTGVGMGL